MKLQARRFWVGQISKILCLFLTFTVFLTGCNSGSGPNGAKLSKNKPVTVELWHYYNEAQKAAFDSLIIEFNETVGAEKGIIVEAFNKGNVSELATEVIDSINDKVGSSPVPNIFAAYADTAREVDKAGMVIDLSPYFTESELTEFIPEYVSEGRIGKNNEFEIFPIAKSTEIMMLNKTDWDKFAAENEVSIDDLMTIEKLVEVSKKYYYWTDEKTPSIKNDGKAFFGRDAMANYILIGCKQLGVELFHVENDEVKFNVDEKVMRKIWDCYYAPFINGYFAANGRFRSEDAKVGDILALVGSTTTSSFFPTEIISETNGTYAIETLVLPAPAFEGGEPYAVQQGAGMIVTKSNPEEEYASVEFLKWFTRPERNLNFSAFSGYLPVTKEANSLKLLDETLGKNAKFDASGVMSQTLRAGFEITSEKKLYTNKAFDSGTEARAVVENSLFQKAKADKEEIDKLIESGTSRENAISTFNNDENFKAWLSKFSAELEDTKKGR